MAGLGVFHRFGKSTGETWRGEIGMALLIQKDRDQKPLETPRFIVKLFVAIIK